MDALSTGAAGMVSAVQRFDASADSNDERPGDLVRHVTSRMQAKGDF